MQLWCSYGSFVSWRTCHLLCFLLLPFSPFRYFSLMDICSKMHRFRCWALADFATPQHLRLLPWASFHWDKGKDQRPLPWCCIEYGQYSMASETIMNSKHCALGHCTTWLHANDPLCMHGPVRYCTRHMYEFTYEHFIVRWCPETYGQWTLDSSHVDWWKVAHAASLQMLFGEAKTMVVEARKKGTWVLLQNCHLYKKLGWHSYPCFTQLHILTHAAHHRCYLAPSVLHWLLWEECDLLCWCWFNPDLTCVCFHPIPLAYYQSGNHNCSRTHTFKIIQGCWSCDRLLSALLQVLRFICSLTQVLIRENGAATMKEHGFFTSCQASNNFRLCMAFLYTMLLLATFQTVCISLQELPGPWVSCAIRALKQSL